MSAGVTQGSGVSAVPGMEQTNGVVAWPDGTPPATSSSAGVAGTVVFSGATMYRCYATNQWVSFVGTTFP